MLNVEKLGQKIGIDKLLNEKMEGYLPAEKIAEVASAYAFAENAHKGQKRLSGDPFFEHPKQTALFLADLRMDASTISAALLHDVLEDCDVSYDEISEKFGTDVANLVDGVTKLTRAEVMGDEQFLESTVALTQPEDDSTLDDLAPVSYTHLTLPTILLV